MPGEPFGPSRDATGHEFHTDSNGRDFDPACDICRDVLERRTYPEIDLRDAEQRAFTEDELSDDARAVLAYARRYGLFTRGDIVDIAPGAAWEYGRWPKTVAKLDPIRELVRAGFVVEHDEQPVKSNPRKTYKRWKLTGIDTPRTLAGLLGDLLGATDEAELEEIKAEVLRRFGDPR